MFGGLFNRIIAPARKEPERVRWAANTPGHSLWKGDDGTQEFGKCIIYGGIVISSIVPKFGQDNVWIHLSVTNRGRKALGFGAAGSPWR